MATSMHSRLMSKGHAMTTVGPSWTCRARTTKSLLTYLFLAIYWINNRLKKGGQLWKTMEIKGYQCDRNSVAATTKNVAKSFGKTNISPYFIDIKYFVLFSDKI
jgi:hypothetical protein